jgi:hypothetical protein
VSLLEIIILTVGVVIGALLSGLRGLRRRAEPAPVRVIVQPEPVQQTKAVLRAQEAVHVEVKEQAAEDAQKLAREARPTGDIKGAVDDLF